MGEVPRTKTAERKTQFFFLFTENQNANGGDAERHVTLLNKIKILLSKGSETSNICSNI